MRRVSGLGLLGFFVWRGLVAASGTDIESAAGTQSKPEPPEAAKAAPKPGHDDPSQGLVPVAEATHTAVVSGSWQDKNTWDNGIPGDGAKVHVPGDVIVTNHGETADLRWIRLDGALEACTHCNTRLRVHTIFGFPTSRLSLGTSTNPVEESSTLEFLPGPFLKTDNQQLSLGLVSSGVVTACGKSKTAWSELLSGTEVKVGGTTLSLADVPYRWSIGDELLIAGTDSTHIPHADQYQTERITITAVRGRIIQFEPPARYRHFPWRDDLRVHVANVSRNVVIRSRVPESLSSRGHMMFLSSHNDLRWCSSVDLGRTDKSRPVTDPRKDPASRNLVAGSDSNPRGRYADHNHKCGPYCEPARRQGVVIDGSPGWGMVNHDSNCEWDECIAVRCFGSGFTTEEGQERGHIRRCLAALCRGEGDTIASTDADHGRAHLADWGSDGSGFWLQGGLVDVEQNVSFDNAGRGFALFNQPFNGFPDFDRDLPEHLRFPITVDGALLPEQFSGRTVGSGQAPFCRFDSNTAYNCKVGVQAWSTIFDRPPEGVHSRLTNTTLWGRGATMHVEYLRDARIHGLTVVGDMVFRDKHASISKFRAGCIVRFTTRHDVTNYDHAGTLARFAGP